MGPVQTHMTGGQRWMDVVRGRRAERWRDAERERERKLK